MLASLAIVAFGLRYVAASSLPESSASAAPVEPLPLPAREPVASASRPPRPAAELVAGTCTFPELGLGDYQQARTASGTWVIARSAAIAPDGSYDLLLHSHGGEAVRKILAPLAKPLVIATIDRGDSSGDYVGTFPSKQALDGQLAAIDATVSKLTGTRAHATRVALSSFSAGFEATREALGVGADEPSLTGVILLDSLYGSYEGSSRSVDPTRLAVFESAARRALEKPRFAFLLTHSEVETDGYASTAEVASLLLDRLVVRSSIVARKGPRGLVRVAEERGFSVRGYGGNDKGAHCAHLALLPDLVDQWRSRL